jgi:hypothetical protein
MWLSCAVALLVIRVDYSIAQTTRPAVGDNADVPVRRVSLFSSGFGFFEHAGTVREQAEATLSFKTEQVNDVLKSLLLQDLDGGTAGTVSYPSQEPLERTLKSFQVDVTDNPSLADLLNQLRGAKLNVTNGGQTTGGTILGVETRVQPAKEGSPAVTRHLLNLKAGRKVKVIPLEGVDDFELDDAKLDEELNRALEAVAQARDQTKKPVTIHFRGQGERRVRLGYVVETPIWKTSYRLVLSGQAAPEKKKGAAAQGTEPGRAAPIGPARSDSPPRNEGGAAQARPSGDGMLQGWAIVENQTDSDWNNVQLTLVSGRPISFIQDLYHPLYVPRPVVKAELYASLRPQTYEGGVTPEEQAKMEGKRAAAEDLTDRAPTFDLRATTQPAKRDGRGSSLGLFGNSGGGGGSGGGGDELNDPVASVRALASGSAVGELFQYTVGNVSIARQKSAMIPIVTEDVELEKVVVFNDDVLERHPLNGVRLKNTTKNHLLQGPVTVLEAGVYAGDARIENLPPGQERLLTYGVDLQTEVLVEAKSGPSTLATGKIVNGMLHVRRTRVDETVYLAENKSDADKLLVIEQPRDDEGQLVEPPQAEEMTDNLYRFRRPLSHGKAATFAKRVRVAQTEYVQLLDAKSDAIGVFASAKEIPEPVRKALVEAQRLKSAADDAKSQLAERNQRLENLSREQSRIRENMKTVSESSEYYTRLLKKLDEQETTIETLQKEGSALQRKAEESRQALEAYLRDLNVG